MKMEKTLKTNKDVQVDQSIEAELNPAVEVAELETNTQVQTLEKQDVEQGLADDSIEQASAVEFTETPAAKPRAKSKKRRQATPAQPDSTEPQIQADASALSDAQPAVDQSDDLTDSLRDLEGKLEELSRNVEQTGDLITDSAQVTQELIASTEQAADTASSESFVEPEQSSEQIQVPADETLQDQPAQDFNSDLANDVTVEASTETSTLISEPESIEQNIEINAALETDANVESLETTDVQVETLPDLTPEIQETPNDVPQPLTHAKQNANYSGVLAVHHDRGGKIAEEYRALRTNLLSKCSDDRFCFMVVSADAGEGKTVTCLNLALIMTERLDRRTIVVDYNLRDGKMAQLLGAGTGPGISDVLLGSATLEQAIQPTAYPNLFFISAGNVDSDRAGELLSRSTVKEIIRQLKENYEYVLLDTPAVNTYSDAGVTGLAATDALLVVRMNKTPRDSVERAILSLQATNVNIVGMLLTHRQPRWFS